MLLACSGIGATTGALVIATLSGVRRKERLTLAGMVLFSFFLAAAAVLPLIAGPSWTSGARLCAASFCLLGAGFGAVLFYSSSMMVIQLAVPDRLRGRVMGIWMIGFLGFRSARRILDRQGRAIVGRGAGDGRVGGALYDRRTLGLGLGRPDASWGATSPEFPRPRRRLRRKGSMSRSLGATRCQERLVIPSCCARVSGPRTSARP